MNQNQCVPNWDLDNGRPSTIQPPPPPAPTIITRSLTSHSHSASLSAGHDTSMQDYEMAELAWENGQLTMHGLGLPRFQSKNNIGGTWADKTSTHVGGTLESIVNQATHKLPLPLTPIIGLCEYDDDLVPFINPNTIHKTSDPTPVSMAPMDALVPTTSTPGKTATASKAINGCSTRVGSCSAAGIGVPGHSDWSVSVSGSDKWRGSKRGPDDTCDQLRSITNNEMTSTSLGVSLDNTTTRTVTFDDREHDSVCHSKPQKDKVDDEDNQTKKATSSAKRSRAAAVHNQSERKRRDKINQRMKTLQKLVPNANKVDKASMLDEVIDYMKQLQSQIQVFNTMRLPQMMMPLALQQQQLQLSLMASMGMPMGIGMGMGMGMGMNMDQMNMNLNPMGLPNIPGMPTPSILNPAAYMSIAAPTDMGDRVASQPTNMVPTDPLSMFLTSQSHSTTMDAYNRMTAMCQQLQHHQQQQLQQQQQQQQQSLKHETNNR